MTLNNMHKVVGDSSCKPNHMTMSSVRSTDARVGTLDLCEWVLEYIKFEVAKGIMGSSKILNMGYI